MIETTPRKTWPIIVIAIATLLVFAPLCAHDFTWWDDWATVHQNPALNPPTLRSLTHYWSNAAYGLYAPMTYTVWIALARVSYLDQPDADNVHLNPWVFHSANVLVHVIAALAAFALLRRITKRDVPGLLGALLFALHPLQVETVGWVSGMKDVLAGCLGLVALWRYVVRLEREPDSIAPDLWGTIALLAAMLSKSSAMMVPFVGIAIARFVLSRDWRTSIRSMGVWMALAIPFAIVARIVQNTTGLDTPPLWARPFIAGDSLAFYFFKFIAPLKLGVDYGRTPAYVMTTPTFYFAWLAPAAVLVGAWLARRGAPFGAALVFIIPILPVSGLTTFLFQFTSTVADHYVYLAMLGPAIALAMLLRKFEERPVAPLIAGAMMFLLAGRSFVQTLVWTNDQTLFENAVAVNPRSYVGYNNLGHYHLRHREYEPAEHAFRTAIDRNPDFADAWNNLGFILLANGDADGAIVAKERAIEIRSKLPPDRAAIFVDAHKEVGQLLLDRGQFDRAIKHFEEFLKVKPEDDEARRLLERARAGPGSAPSTTRTSN